MGYQKIKRPLLAHDFVDDHPVVGGAYMQDNTVATALSGESVGTSLVAAGTATLKAESHWFELSGTTMTYNGLGRPRIFKATLMASLISGNHQDLKLSLAKNGVVLGETHMEVITTGGISRREPLSTQGLISLAPGDTLAPFVSNETSAVDVTVHDMTLIIEAIN